MSNRPEDISSILREQIRNYKSKIEMAETGTVTQVLATKGGSVDTGAPLVVIG